MKKLWRKTTPLFKYNDGKNKDVHLLSKQHSDEIITPPGFRLSQYFINDKEVIKIFSYGIRLERNKN